MKKMKKLSILCIVAAFVILLSACVTPPTGGTTGDSKQTDPVQAPAKPKEISILAITFTGTPIAEDEPSVLALEELTA
jgi:putative aldouronate transport system substrate-binding protein